MAPDTIVTTTGQQRRRPHSMPELLAACKLASIALDQVIAHLRDVMTADDILPANDRQHLEDLIDLIHHVDIRRIEHCLNALRTRRADSLSPHYHGGIS